MQDLRQADSAWIRLKSLRELRDAVVLLVIQECVLAYTMRSFKHSNNTYCTGTAQCMQSSRMVAGAIHKLNPWIYALLADLNTKLPTTPRGEKILISSFCYTKRCWQHAIRFVTPGTCKG